MKKIFCTLLVICTTNIALSQEGTVTIEQDEKIETLLKHYKDLTETSEYYTIQIYSSKNPMGAENAKATANKNFPGWHSSLDFIRESYKVTIGKFKTHYEGQQKHQLVKKKYPNSLLIKPKKK